MIPVLYVAEPIQFLGSGVVPDTWSAEAINPLDFEHEEGWGVQGQDLYSAFCMIEIKSPFFFDNSRSHQERMDARHGFPSIALTLERNADGRSSGDARGG